MLRLVFRRVVFLCSVSLLGFGQNSAPAKQTLLFSCAERSFLSVAVSTPKHDGFPPIDLSLTGPDGRVAGKNSKGERIPHSNYGRIVQIPHHPERSKAKAIEICDAEQGVYGLNVMDNGNKPYYLVVSASGKAAITDSLILNHIAHARHTREYKFMFEISREKLTLSWLDEKGKKQLLIETPEW